MLKRFNNYNESIDYSMYDGVDKNILLKMFIDKHDFEGVKYAIENGADINYDDSYVLRFFCYYGRLDIVKYLVEKGVNVNVSLDSPIRIASDNNKFDVVMYLLDHGADINKVGVYHIIRNNDIDILKKLIKKGFNIHKNGVENLKVAYIEDSIDIIKYLVNIGINTDSVKKWVIDNNLDKTNIKLLEKPEYNTPRKLVYEGIKHLLVGPTKDEIWENIKNLPPSDIFRISIKNNIIKGVKYAMENGGLDRRYDDIGLNLACEEGNLELVKYFVERGATINMDIDNESLRTKNPLLTSVRNDNTEISIYLIENGAMYKNRMILFNIALNHYNYELIKYFIEIGFSRKISHANMVNYSKNTDTYKGYMIKDLMMKNGLCEGINHLLVGPTEEEILNNLKDNPLKLYDFALKQGNDVLKNIAEKLITPLLKLDIIECIVDANIEGILDDYTVQELEEFEESDNIYDVSIKYWIDAQSHPETKYILKEKLIDIYSEKPMNDLFEELYDMDIELW